jgi:hypothetical protein
MGLGVRPVMRTSSPKSTPYMYDPPVDRIALASHEALFFELVDEPGHIPLTDTEELGELPLRGPTELQCDMERHVRQHR